MEKELDLCGTWDILPVNRFDGNYDANAAWFTANVPGHWQETPGLENHTGKTVYKKRFKFRPEPEKRLFIRVGGVFYWYTAYLNGVRLGANEGYFFPADYEVTGLLEKDNELLLEVDCPTEDDLTRKRQMTGVFHHRHDKNANPGGVWLPVEIMSSGPVSITGALFHTVYIRDNGASARIVGEVTVSSEKKLELDIDLSFIPRTFSGDTQTFKRQVFLSPGKRTYQYNLDLANPVLWQSSDRGRPDLYTLQVQARPRDDANPSDNFSTAFGVRTVETRAGITYVNGEKLYIRAGNYPPPDFHVANVNRSTAEKDLDLATSCNLNMLRVSGHVGHPDFYLACDEKGMLVFQDFPLHGGYNKEVLYQSLRQAEKMVYHLGNHPCIAGWCMHNEPYKIYDTSKRAGPLDYMRLFYTKHIRSHDREVMDPRLAGHARYLDPYRPVIAYCGEPGWFRKPERNHPFYYRQMRAPYGRESMRSIIDRTRAMKYKPGGGCLAHHMPVDSSRGVQRVAADYYRQSEENYSELQKAMSPVYAFIVPENKRYKRSEIVSIPVYAVNDDSKEVNIRVTLSVTSPVGDMILEREYHQMLEADSMALALDNAQVRLRWEGVYRAVIVLQTGKDRLENVYELEVK